MTEAAEVERWRVTDAADGDLPLLARIMAASPLLRRYGMTEAQALEALHKARAAGDILLAVRDTDADAACGLAWVIPTRAFDYGAYLRLLLVSRDAQNAGAGRRLMQEVEARGRPVANHLYLLVTRDNHAARRFYERLGFRQVGELPALVRPDLDEVLYHKRLRPHRAQVAAASVPT